MAQPFCIMRQLLKSALRDRYVAPLVGEAGLHQTLRALHQRHRIFIRRLRPLFSLIHCVLHITSIHPQLNYL